MATSETPSDTIVTVGPYPNRSIAALLELGMTHAEVARYFRIAPQAVKRLELGGEEAPPIAENRARATPV